MDPTTPGSAAGRDDNNAPEVQPSTSPTTENIKLFFEAFSSLLDTGATSIYSPPSARGASVTDSVLVPAATKITQLADQTIHTLALSQPLLPASVKTPAKNTLATLHNTARAARWRMAKSLPSMPPIPFLSRSDNDKIDVQPSDPRYDMAARKNDSDDDDVDSDDVNEWSDVSDRGGSRQARDTILGDPVIYIRHPDRNKRRGAFDLQAAVRESRRRERYDAMTEAQRREEDMLRSAAEEEEAEEEERLRRMGQEAAKRVPAEEWVLGEDDTGDL